MPVPKLPLPLLNLTTVCPVNHSEHPLDMYTFEDDTKCYQMDQVEGSSCRRDAEVDHYWKRLTAASIAADAFASRTKGGQRLGGGSESHIEMKLICPVADHFVLCCSIAYLVLVDLVATRGVPVFIEEHRVTCNTCKKGPLVQDYAHTHTHTCQKCYLYRLWTLVFTVATFPYKNVWLPGISPSGSQVMQSGHRSFSWLPPGKNKLLRAATSHSARQTESAVACVSSSSFVSLAIEQHSVNCQSRTTKLQSGYKPQVHRWTADPAVTLQQHSPLSSQSAPYFIVAITMAKSGVFLCAF